VNRAASVDSDEIHGINITPLVDIVLVLLIIFMVSTSVVMKQTIEVQRPTFTDEGMDSRVVPTVVMLSLDADGRLYFDGENVNRVDAATKLRNAHKSDRALRAIIAADSEVGYGDVVRLIDLVRGEGIEKLAVVAFRPE